MTPSDFVVGFATGFTLMLIFGWLSLDRCTRCGRKIYGWTHWDDDMRKYHAHCIQAE